LSIDGWAKASFAPAPIEEKPGRPSRNEELSDADSSAGRRFYRQGHIRKYVPQARDGRGAGGALIQEEETKMKAIKPVFASVLAAALLCMGTTAARAADLLDAVKQAGVLKIAIEGTYPPFTFRGAGGSLEGFDVDVAKAVAAKLGVKAEFVVTEWGGIIAGLKEGKFDVIVNQVTITPERQQALDFSQPYVFSAAQLIQRAKDDRQITALADFTGDKTLGVTAGSNYHQMARAVSGINVKTYDGAPEKLTDLVRGRIDATIDDRLMVAHVIKQFRMPLRPGAILKGPQQEMGIPFRKGNPNFAKAINEALTSMRQDGTLKNISVQWFGADTSMPAAL
jgi:L-cystine transport system substrate-binding protein